METYNGQVRSPADAIKLFEACRLGLLPRVQRRLSEKERGAIRSGSVFVWDEKEAGMRRWTDGKSWSASRVSGSFLTYREMEGKRGSGFGGSRRGTGKSPGSGRGSDEDRDDHEPEGYRYKADGLLKQSFSLTILNGQHLHLISYISRPHSDHQELMQPTNDPSLRQIIPAKGMYPESSLPDSNHQSPAMSRASNSTHTGSYQQPLPPPGQGGNIGSYGYRTQYAQQPAYGWLPSPVATPPFTINPTSSGYTSQPTAAPYNPVPYSVGQSHSLPPPPASQPRTTLPPLPPNVSPQMGYMRPAGDQLRPPIPPHIAQRTPASELGLNPGQPFVSQSPALPPILSYATTTTPPSRTHSVSPPQSSHSDTNTYSLAASNSNIVNKSNNGTYSHTHTSPTNYDPSSINPASTGSSPNMLTSGRLPSMPDRELVSSEDRRTTNLLNSRFRI